MSRIIKAITIVLAVLFLVTMTAGAVSADGPSLIKEKRAISLAKQDVSKDSTVLVTAFATTTSQQFKKAKISIEK